MQGHKPSWWYREHRVPAPNEPQDSVFVASFGAYAEPEVKGNRAMRRASRHPAKPKPLSDRMNVGE